MKLDKMKVQLAWARTEKTAVQLAEEYGCTQQGMISVLNKKSFTPATAGRLARVLNVDVTEIIED